MHLAILSCKKATFLIEKSQVRRLSFLQRLQLKMHLKICDGCFNYQRQSRLIEGLLKSAHTDFSTPTGFKLSEKSKSLIQKKIEENLKKK